jgi:uncharacterized phage-associated protein
MAHEAKRVAEYVLWLGREASVTPMRLLKLVYISHGWMLALRDQPLFRESAEAWRYGPVVSSVYHAYKQFGGNTITEVPAQEPAGFSDDEKNIMSQVWTAYLPYNGVQLSALTHQPNSPWEITVRESGMGARISNDLIKEYYRNLSTARA